MRRLKIKAVIFDMDGVITDTMPFHFRAWEKIFKNEGLHVTECEIYLREGQPGNVTIKEIFRERGLRLSREILARILRAKEEMFKESVGRHFISGSRPYIRTLKSRGYMLALVTGTARHEVVKILPKSILGLFDVTVAGDEVEKGKPDPEPYLIALKKLGIKPREAVVLENAPFGIQSARSAGIKCLALETSLPKKYLKGAYLVFASFDALRKGVELTLSED